MRAGQIGEEVEIIEIPQPAPVERPLTLPDDWPTPAPVEAPVRVPTPA